MPKVGERFNPHRLFDGAFVPEAICRYRGVSPGAKIIYGRFCRFAGKRGEVFPSITTLAEEVGLSAKQARRYVQELADARFIQVEYTEGGVNTYYFIWHEAFDGEIGEVRFSRGPLPDQGGVDSPETPPGSGSTPLPDQGGGPLPDQGGIRESNEESHEENQTNGGKNDSLTVDLELYDPDGEAVPIPGPVRKRWPKKPKPPENPNSTTAVLRRMREGGTTIVPGDAPSCGVPERVYRGSDTPNSASGPPTPVVDYAARWNSVVLSAPVDPDVVPVSCPAYGGKFAEKFDDVCRKVEELNRAGAGIGFMNLVSCDRKSQLFGWQKVLGGAWDWVKKGNGKTPSWLDKYK